MIQGEELCWINYIRSLVTHWRVETKWRKTRGFMFVVAIRTDIKLRRVNTWQKAAICNVLCRILQTSTVQSSSSHHYCNYFKLCACWIGEQCLKGKEIGDQYWSGSSIAAAIRQHIEVINMLQLRVRIFVFFASIWILWNYGSGRYLTIIQASLLGIYLLSGAI